MRATVAVGILAASLGTALMGSASAHHSLAAEFDTRKIVHLVGVVSQVDWVNPHIYIHVDVKGAKGKVDSWRLECVPTAMARKSGITRTELLGDGSEVQIDAYPARDGTPNLGFLAKISYKDGHHYQFGSDVPAPAAK